MVEAAIRAEHFRKAFGGTVAVDDVCFTVAPGTVAGLLGPNGAGKTTVINCLSTLERPDSGQLSIMGHDTVREAALVRAQIAVSGQSTAVDEMLTGRENLVLFGRLLRLGKAAARRRAAELAERLGIGDEADRAVRTYSGGMRRRLDLAVSLVVPRPVLFLDEPSTGLDPRSRFALWDAVRDLRAAGTSVLLTTQYLEEADQLADTILLMDKGKVVAEGSPAELRVTLGGAVCEARVPDPARLAAARTALAEWFGQVTVDDDLIRLPATGLGTLADVVKVLDGCGAEATEVSLRSPTLEEIFLTLTAPVATP